MCGFVGYLNSKNIKVGSINEMMESIKHRGPDGQDIYSNDQFTVGHVRLSLVDLELGNQPMFFNEYIIVFNGEIYNHSELREFLLSLGYTFKTLSDTEVILKLFDYYSYSFIEHLNGIFSIVIYNCNTNELVFSRDYFGTKPLYIYNDCNTLVFSSELKAIFSFLKYNNIEYVFNDKALTEFLVKGYISESHIINNIQIIPTGKVIAFINSCFIDKYEIIVSSVKSNQDDIEQTLQSQIIKELDADVDVGILLSGGIDSSLLTHLAAKSKNDIKTFSIGFQNSKTYDETIYSRFVAEQCNTTHKQFLFTEDDLLNKVDDLIACLDQPVYDPAMLPMLFLCENVKADVKAVLSGDGGDELFGGYLHHRVTYYYFFVKIILFFYKPIKYIFPKILLLKNIVQSLGKANGPFFHSLKLLNQNYVFESKVFKSYKDAMSFDIQNELKYKLLVKTDLTSMYKGLEIRVPFLNRELFSKSLSLTPSDLFNLSKGKMILRKVLSKYLDKKIVNKRKVGFRVPIKEWVSNGKLGYVIENSLNNELFIPETIIKSETIKFMLSKRGEQYYFDELFSLFILNQWIKKNKYYEGITNQKRI